MNVVCLLAFLGSAFAESPEKGTAGDNDRHVMKVREGGATSLRSGLPRAALSDSTFEQEDECRSVCEDDVLDNDVCIGTATNPVPNGEVWMFNRDTWWSYGCCAFGLGACKECCPPTEDDKLAFENADDAVLTQNLYTGMGADIENFDNENNDDDPWKFYIGTCLTLSNFTIISPGSLPISNVMQLLVRAGTSASGNGRSRNGFFFTDEGVYIEMSQLSFLNGGSITYRILGYDYSDQRPGSRRGYKRVVELPWQLAPHGDAMFTEYEANPQEYGPADKIAYRLISPYMGEVLVKAECCTQEELVAYEYVSEGPLGYLTRPDPPVRYTRSAEQCEQIQPAYERFAPL